MNIKNVLFTPARTARNTLRWVIAGLLCGLAASSHAQLTTVLYATPSITASSAGGKFRNNNNGGVGCGFTVNSSANVLVSHLGFFSTNKVAGLSTSYYVGVYGGTLSSHTLLGQVIVPAGTSAYYTNSFYWAPLNPPVLLTNNTTYWLETETTSGYADWFGDSFVPTWNSWCVGSQATTTRWSTYGGTSATDTWPLTTGFTVLTKNGTYCVANMAYIPVGPPGVVVQQTGATIGSCQSSATNVVLNGYASGAATLGYQWYYNGSPMSDGGLISGSSSATLTISTATSANAGTYYLVATNLLGTAQSANVPVVSDFGVPQPPTNTTVAQGYTAKFYSAAVAVSPITYQWYSNGLAVAGATASTFSETAQMANNGDIYSCCVTNTSCSTVYGVSNYATLTVLPNLASATTAQFLHGYWPTLDDNTGSGTEGGVFTIGNNNETVTYLGYYAWGGNTTVSGNTSNCTLTVSHRVGIWNSSGSTLLGYVTVPAGSNPVLNGYMWQPLNPPLVLTNHTTYLLMAEHFANHVDPCGDTYPVPDLNSSIASSCAAWYGGNWGTSLGTIYGNYSGQMYSGANLAILESGNPAVFIQPATIAQVAGTAASLTAALDGQAPLALQWYQNGAPLAGQTNLTLSFSTLDPTNAGNYYAVVTNASLSLSATSTVSTVTVYTSPVILSVSPQTYGNTITLFRGATANFTLTSVAGFTPFSYQWYTNGVPDVSGTSTNYSLTNVQASLTSCACVVTNSAGKATNTWTVSVIAAPTTPYPAAVLRDNPIGYWRLNESDNGTGNNGALANDYWGGNVGVYSNTILNQAGYSAGLATQYGYSPATDPNEASAQFGYYPSYPTTANYAANIPGINFAATNQSATFSVEAWAKGDSAQNGNSAGIVAKGAWSAEQFTLDTGGTSSSYRFTMRDAQNNLRTATSNTNFPDANWHHLVGVLDEVHSNLTFYVDGVKVANTLLPTATNGVLSSAVPVSIGARLGSDGAYSQQFFGNVNDVAIYNYALSASQVTNHYLAAGIAPRFTLQPPATTNVNEGTTLSIPVQAIGSLPLSYQWYDITAGSPGTAVPGQTGPTLVVPNVNPAGYDGHTFALTVTNIYGQATSSGVSVSVAAGAPNTVTVTPATPPTMYAGLQVVFTVTAQGTQPFHYQWSVDGSMVGVTTSTYTNTVAVGTHTIGCSVTNSVGLGTPYPATASVTGIAAPTDSYGLRILRDQPLAFWRLDEPSGNGNGGTANDYVGGHNGTYNNAVTGLEGFSPSDPDTAAGFGMNAVLNDSVVVETDNSGYGIPNIDFSQQGVNAQFSIEAWVNAPTGQPGGAGILTKGYGSGGEQFNLDVYGNAFRFFMRDASGGVHGPTSTVAADGEWHHLVGVCDEANGAVYLYIDGVLDGTSAMSPGLGVRGPLPTGAPILTSIGARDQTVSDSSYLLQLSSAEVAEVAIYNYALSSSQVTAHYSEADEPVSITVQPSPDALVLYQGLSVTYSVTADGSPPLSYQWQKNGVSMFGPGPHTNTLTFASIVPGDTGSYDVVVTNAGGAVTSSVVTLTVIPAPTTAYQSLIVAASPLYYWQLNETNGDIAYDSIGGLNGTYGGGTTLGEPGVSDPPFYGFPSNNFAVAMNSSDSTAGDGYVTAPALGLNTNTLTITCWVYPFADITGYNGVVFSRASTYSKGIQYVGLGTSRFNMLGYTWNSNSVSTYGWPSGLITPPGQWSFVALTIAPNQAVMYCGTNGVLLAATNAIPHDVEAFNGIICFGADSGSLPGRIFGGKMDEVAVFNSTLTPTQIQQLYATATTVSTLPTVNLTIQWAGSNLILGWPQGILLQAPTVHGPWTTNSAAAPPSYTVSPSGTQMFYRVQVR